MSDLDPRFHAYRADLADISLQEEISAYNYVSSTRGFCGPKPLPLRRYPQLNAPLDSVLIPFEEVKIFEILEGIAWVQSTYDGYVGYVEVAGLLTSEPDETPCEVLSHSVITTGTYIYPSPDIKSVPQGELGFASNIAAKESAHPNFMQVMYPSKGAHGYVYKSHLRSLNALPSDTVALARMFLDVPYLWGGRSLKGIDCSGLVQLVCKACGVTIPRDTDAQFKHFDKSHKIMRQDVQAGDLIFWKGHVAMATSPDTMIHANGHHMVVAEEAIDSALKRILAEWGDVIGFVKNPIISC